MYNHFVKVSNIDMIFYTFFGRLFYIKIFVMEDLVHGTRNRNINNQIVESK